MITVVVVFQHFDCFLTSQLQFVCKHINVCRHLAEQLFFCNSTNPGIFLIHAYIVDVVQFAEDAELREFCNTRHEHEAQHRLTLLQRTVEVAHKIPQTFELLVLMNHIKQRSVILVDKHNHLLARLIIDGRYEICKAHIGIHSVTLYAEPTLVFFKNIVKVSVQLVFFLMLATRKVEMKHGIFRPLLFQPIHCQSLEEFLATFKIALQCRDKKRFAESARTAKEEEFAVRIRHTINIDSLVYIKIVISADLRESLYA